MKKVGLLICLALLTGCTSKLESKIEITDNNKETVIELQDKSFITKYNVLYNGKDIKEALENKEITIEDFINNMQEVSTANDGGSKLYKATDKNKKLYKINYYPFLYWYLQFQYLKICYLHLHSLSYLRQTFFAL